MTSADGVYGSIMCDGLVGPPSLVIPTLVSNTQLRPKQAGRKASSANVKLRIS